MQMQTLKKENEELKEQLKHQGSVIRHHQAFMERVDAKERSCNLIIMGVKENDDQEADSDAVKVQEILEVVGAQSTVVKSVRRMGTKESNKNRAMLIECSTTEERNRIVEAARGLSAEQLSGVRLKKDAHPSVRAEWRRLFQVKKEEEKKAENVGARIRVDLRKRQVLRNDQVIDSWCNQLF